MKFLLYLYFIALLPTSCYADAGFNIQRVEAPCYAVIKGIDKLNDYEFIKIYDFGEKQNRDELSDSSHRVNNNDKFKIYYTERNNLGTAIKILIRNKITQQFVDSLSLTAKGYDLTINFSGVENNKVKYTIDKSKAEYPYQLFSGEDVDASVGKRNKFILISLSVIGFLTLAFMFYKRRNTDLSQSPEKI